MAFWVKSAYITEFSCQFCILNTSHFFGLFHEVSLKCGQSCGGTVLQMRQWNPGHFGSVFREGHLVIIIIIITLFQEDNIFGRVASLTYGPQLTNVGHDIKMNRRACTIIYSMYRVNALRTPSRLRAGYPTLLQWRGRYDFSRLKTNRVLLHTSVLVIGCFLTRSMLFLKCIYTHYIQSFFSPAQYQKRYLS